MDKTIGRMKDRTTDGKIDRQSVKQITDQISKQLACISAATFQVTPKTSITWFKCVYDQQAI